MGKIDHPQSRRKLLNHVVEDIARENPDKLYAEIPHSPTTFEGGFRRVTYKNVANAINGIAALIEKSLGKGQDFPTLVYYGVTDIRYIIILLGAVKAGYKMLFPSPRFSPIAVVELFKKTGAKAMLLPTPRPPVADPILELYPMQQIGVPGLELLDTEYPDYAFDTTFEDACDQPLVVLHTSGSTGFPKPIIWTHGWAASFAEELYLAPPPGYESTSGLMLGRRIFNFFPAFHSGHLMGNLLFPIWTGTVNVYPLPGLPPSGDQVVNVLDHAQVDTLCMIPPIIEFFAHKPDLLEKVAARVDCMMYAGGDVSAEVGNAVSAKLKLFTQIGSTEVGIFHHLRRAGEWKPENWHHVIFHPSSNVRLPNRQGKSCEAVVQRNTDGYKQTVFNIFSDASDYATGDLFKQHSNDSKLWEYHGRIDDMQIFLSGEKFYPVDVENMLSQHKDIKEAILLGTGRTQGALLLDLGATSKGDQKEISDQIWAHIEAANELCPEYAKVSREHVLVADPKRPIVRTAKGNVQREATRKLYAADLEKLDVEAARKHAPVPATAFELLTEKTEA